MAVSRVYGTVDGAEVDLELGQDGLWSVPVPLDQDGEYAVEIMAEDEAGNRSYLARMLYTVEAGTICIRPLPFVRFVFRREPDPYRFTRTYPICREVVP